MIADRRKFLRATGSAFAALAANGCARGGLVTTNSIAGYGPLVPDSRGLIDLPAGFTYRVLSSLGDAMSDGGTVPDHADGMGCFDLGGGKWALVRNHELVPNQDSGGATGLAYDTVARSLVPLPGGTTTLVLDARTLAVERQFRSLSGTIRNCAGGVLVPRALEPRRRDERRRHGARPGRRDGLFRPRRREDRACPQPRADAQPGRRRRVG